jgi:hypothetical protein
VYLTFVGSVLAMALLQGALVALPSQDALARLTRFRSPRWAIVLPGLIVVGTFGLALIPSGAVGLAELASFAFPAFAALAAIAVVGQHLRTAATLGTLAALVCALLCHGVVAQVAASMITAAGALLVGAVLMRLMSERWLLVAIAGMCLVDVVLMHFGVGQLSSQLLNEATGQIRGPNFEQADIGTVATEFPDLLLASVIGAFVAGRPQQRRIAVLVSLCIVAYDLGLLYRSTIPATPPLVAAVLLYELHLRFVRFRDSRVWGPPAAGLLVAPAGPSFFVADPGVRLRTAGAGQRRRGAAAVSSLGRTAALRRGHTDGMPADYPNGQNHNPDRDSGLWLAHVNHRRTHRDPPPAPRPADGQPV